MPAPWKRLNGVPQQTGQMQAVQAKKHVTVFMRSSSAQGAGRPEVRQAFKACAVTTRDDPDRMSRNVKMKQCMESKGLRTDRFVRKSRGKYGGLKGKVYVNGVLSAA
ncbi:MAG: hypothetical protein PHQ43_09740 [Dehalococcoidales bacterium]|nr:hypothetical protein [Dehalococcoidales bacterium]